MILKNYLQKEVSIKTDLEIRDANVQAHIDIETDIHNQQEGLYTFTIRINGGNIVDLNVVEYVSPVQYRGIETITIQESSFAFYSGK